MYKDTGSLFADVEKRKFRVNFDARIHELVDWFNTATDTERQAEGNNKVELFLQLINSATVSDSLEQYLKEQTDDNFYYVGINQFVIDYYAANPNSEWKLKAILQVGFPFEFADPKCKSENSKFNSFIERNYLKDKKWSIFVFTKEKPKKVIIGFDDRNTYSNLRYQKRNRCSTRPS